MESAEVGSEECRESEPVELGTVPEVEDGWVGGGSVGWEGRGSVSWGARVSGKRSEPAVASWRGCESEAKDTGWVFKGIGFEPVEVGWRTAGFKLVEDG